MKCQFFTLLAVCCSPPILLPGSFGEIGIPSNSGEIACFAISPEHNGQDLNFGFRPEA
jgi:hypothetical protein